MKPAMVLSDLVSNLGGPDIAPADIQEVSDVPNGADLVRWLINQLAELDTSDPEAEKISMTGNRRIDSEDGVLWYVISPRLPQYP